jgi:2-succinyl-6-hydroxy-2,4-cyclohexadiene-1-carboxylate synthase
VNGLVLLHGFTGSPASFGELIGICSARAPGLRCHRPALLGHGTRAGARVVRFEREVDRLAFGIRSSGFSGSHLCGYSLGARLALGLLARHPFLFSGATLIGVHPGLGSFAERAARVGSDERWCQLLCREGVTAFLRTWEAQPLFATQRMLSARSAADQRRIRGSHTAEGLIQSLRVLGLGQMPNYRGVFQVTRSRVRLVAGSLDRRFVQVGRELAAANRGTELELVEGAGHNVLLEAPARVGEIVARALTA